MFPQQISLFKPYCPNLVPDHLNCLGPLTEFLWLQNGCWTTRDISQGFTKTWCTMIQDREARWQGYKTKHSKLLFIWGHNGKVCFTEPPFYFFYIFWRALSDHLMLGHTTFLKFLNKSPMFSFSSTNKNNLIEYEIYY